MLHNWGVKHIKIEYRIEKTQNWDWYRFKLLILYIKIKNKNPCQADRDL